MKLRFLIALFFVLPTFARASDLGTPVAPILTFGAGESDSWLIAGVWPNGRVIWSHDTLRGGPPYFAATIPQAKVAAFLASVDANFKGNRTESSFGPDASFTTPWVSIKGKPIKLQSWHELYETNPGVVALSYGLTALKSGQDREAALRADKKSYREFRASWANLRKQITALVPASGEPYAGAVNITLPKTQ